MRSLRIGPKNGTQTRSLIVPLRGMTMHGLRATAVVRLRRAGAEPTQIADCIGMSLQMVQHYCRLSYQRDNALAAVVHLDRLQGKRQQNPARGAINPYPKKS
jgi:hypothetical protein